MVKVNGDTGSNTSSILSCTDFVHLTSNQIFTSFSISNQTLAGLLPRRDIGCALVSKVWEQEMRTADNYCGKNITHSKKKTIHLGTVQYYSSTVRQQQIQKSLTSFFVV